MNGHLPLRLRFAIRSSFTTGFAILFSIATRAADAPAPREFAPGVRIDWPNLTIELDAEVVMRQGPLELFACSPNTKEHESILKVFAKPTHIYQAMGLVGLTPGRPVRFDEKENRFDPPTGDALDIRVRYTDEHGRTITASPENWVTTTKPQALVLTLPWVFAGSSTLPDGRFAADIEGTVICLVDFEAALIAIPALHSAANEQLWLVAKTDAIPPKGTKCTLLIRSSKRTTLEVELVDEHSVWHDGRLLDENQFSQLVRGRADDPRPVDLVLLLPPYISDEVAESVLRRLREGHKGTLASEVRRIPAPRGLVPRDKTRLKYTP